MKDTTKIVEEFSSLPKFPDGRINYSKSSKAPVIIVFVKYKNKILLLKRSNKVSTYKLKWQTVAGYIDEDIPLKNKVEEELKEEIKIESGDYNEIKFGEPYKITDKEINKTWIIHPCLVELNKEKEIKIDWEHTEFVWIKPEEINNYDIVPNVIDSLRRVL